jgi:hypothetical protein
MWVAPAAPRVGLALDEQRQRAGGSSDATLIASWASEPAKLLHSP